jgi:2-deoxy-D-gluconate 3-dehydrogenase
MGDGELAGQVVVVTGAGRGLGRALAIAVTRAGAAVVGVARTQSELAVTASLAGERFVPIGCDLTATPADELAEQAEAVAGPVDGVVHAAGAQLRKPATQVTRDEWRAVLSINLEGPFLLSAAISRHQRRDGRAGSHVFVASMASSIGVAELAPYCAAKSGILGVMRSLAVEWAPSGIRANAIVPGYFPTALTAPVSRAAIVSRIPMGRLGAPAEVTGAAVYLLSGAAGYVTGSTITIDGGRLAS